MDLKEEKLLNGYHNNATTLNYVSYKKISAWTKHWLSDKLNIDIKCINEKDSILSYGLDSLSAVELEKDIITKFHLDFFVGDIFENVSIKDFIENALQRQYDY
jgi:acyl carrier protein